ncbi:ABC transporter permease [Nocardioides lijunqiniae]|uniref:ABC transporter permease n=1 Tax=Nocardioides lijunqiniae TaxID=2760832 RepID=UPI0018780C87|nr:ABC transporter permease [Nocardioides lijunqiniae]
MSNTVLIAKRELRMQLRSRGFLISLVASALVVIALVVAPMVMDSDEEYRVDIVGADSIGPLLEQAAEDSGIDVSVRTQPDERAARQAVADGDADAAVIEDRELLAEGDADGELTTLIQQAHQAAGFEAQLAASELPRDEVLATVTVAPLTMQSVGDGDEHDGARQALAFMILIALLFLLMSTTVSVAAGVIEEKGSRIVEILLVAVRPRELLAGKLLAFGLLGLVQLAVFSAAGFGTAWVVGLTDDLPPGTAFIVAATFTGYAFGFLFFGAMAAALASLTSRQEELNSTLGPMTAATIFSYLGAFFAFNDPDALLSRIATIVPPFSSMAMPVRLASSDVALWEVGLSALLMIAAIAAILALGGRIYERSVLRTGAKARLSEVLAAPGESPDASTSPQHPTTKEKV